MSSIAELLKGAKSPRREAEGLLCAVLACSRAHLYGFADDLVDPLKAQQFRDLDTRRYQGEPFAYLVGYRDFWTLSLRVNGHVLIPRPETEQLVEWALTLYPQLPDTTILDMGTGSGAIALALAAELPDATITGIDISPGALQVAKENGRRLGLTVEWQQGSWFEAFSNRRWGLILSNPPYIAAADPHLQCGDLPAEPLQALCAGATGLECYEQIIRDAPRFLQRDGWLLFEHGFEQGAAVRDLLSTRGFTQIETRRDYAGHERLTGGRWDAE
jgi:release factor glutamine methyltransferase